MELMQNTNQDNKTIQATEHNFWSLTEDYKIVFPRIQRDYAQGRMTFKATQVRYAFLKSLHESLKKDVAELNLDFVYGEQKKGIVEDDKSFAPLDGQQRLTTLFLLYWYLAYKTNNQDNLRQHLSKNVNKETQIRFLYDTRDSAKSFCEQMIVSKVENINDKSVSWNVKNQSWFLTMWTEDPTVQGMLTMLDAMDEEFTEDESVLQSYYVKLTEEGFIRFHVLPFDENYTLGDDLYVKMNARGLALTTFENFKASFEEELLEGDVKKLFVENIDTLWTNMFWYPLIPEKGNPPAKVDNEMMRFVRLLLSTKYACRKEQSSEYENEESAFDEKIFGGLRVNASGKDFIPDEEQNYAYLTSKGILGKDEAKYIVEGFKTIGKYWVENSREWNEEATYPINLSEAWKTFCNKPDYECQLLLLAIIIAPDKNKEIWFRLCRNLICNTIVNDKNDLRWFIVKLFELKDKQNFGLNNDE